MGIFRSFLRIPQPLLLGYLISSLMSTEPQQKIFLYGCALALGFSALMEKLSSQTLMYRCELLGITLSSALNGLVYKVDTFASVIEDVIIQSRSQGLNRIIVYVKTHTQLRISPYYEPAFVWFDNDRKKKANSIPKINITR